MGVRLGKVVKRLEARASAAAEERERASCEYVISYSPDNQVVDRSTVAPGEHVAMDVYAMAAAGTMRTVERVTSDPDDLGYVYNQAGEMIGRLLELDRPFFSYCLRDECADPWPSGPDPGGVPEDPSA